MYFCNPIFEIIVKILFITDFFKLFRILSRFSLHICVCNKNISAAELLRNGGKVFDLFAKRKGTREISSYVPLIN